MNENEQLQLFEDQAIRTAWDEENEEWYFSVVDVVSVLTDAKDYDTARNYWKVTKKRLKDEDSQLVTDCNQLNLLSVFIWQVPHRLACSWKSGAWRFQECPRLSPVARPRLG